MPIVPPTAPAFVTLKVADLVKHPDLKPVLAQLAKQPDALVGASELLGVSPLELDRVTMFWPRLGRDGSDPILVVTTVEPFNEARVLKALQARPVFGADERVPAAGPGGREALEPLFHRLDRGPFATLLLTDERTLVFLPGRGAADVTVLTFLSAHLKKGAKGPLTDALAAAGTHTFAACVYLPPLFREFDGRIEPELAPYTALLGTRTAVLAGDLSQGAKLSLALTFDDATAAKRAAPVLEEGLASLAVGAEKMAGTMRDSRRPLDKAAAPLLSALAAGMKAATVKADGATAVAVAKVDFGSATSKALGDLLQAVQSRRAAEQRMHNLKLIGLALHNYHGSNLRLPTNVYGPKGELLLSWRVQLLPYLEQDALYRQFKLDEPWDSENNKKLIEKMPKVFQAPDRKHAHGETFYQGFVQRENAAPLKGIAGRPWLRDGEKQGWSLAAIPDGTSNTLAVVEAGEGVVWTKPDDLPFGGTVPALGEKGWERTPALLFDGSVLLLPTTLKPEMFWPRVTIDGGEVLPDLDDERGTLFGQRPAPSVKLPVKMPAEPPKPIPTKELEPLPLPKKVGERRTRESLAVKVAALQAQERAAALLKEATARLRERLEKSGAGQVEIERVEAVYVEALARLEAVQRELTAAVEALKAAQEKAPQK
ncbi:DUF1559 domain-containing protein [Gemmata sp. JC717]|uniref:DUF1559 family PulG-like putative transporter n=1 Tax=Gemmata algarum TaxID=2975278 RepID=UPI0021BAE054|nr:DUF1559 domain-containing protein [Gemmata algarum]MDY3554580.1 DUF1559 domain-containing protein [Gemmata algarum]